MTKLNNEIGWATAKKKLLSHKIAATTKLQTSIPRQNRSRGTHQKKEMAFGSQTDGVSCHIFLHQALVFAIGLSFSKPVPQFFGNAEMSVVVLNGLFKITQPLLSIAKITISSSFSGPFSQFFGTANVLVVVLNGLFEIT